MNLFNSRKMIMKNIIFILNTILLALLLSACGGGGGGSSDASFDSGNTKIAIIACNNTTPVYTSIQTGDLLVKEVIPTTVDIVQDSNNNKKVCVVSGAAHLLRDN